MTTRKATKTTKASKSRRTPKGVDPSVKTARNSRRLIVTGTVVDIRAQFPPRPLGQAPASQPYETYAPEGASGRPEESSRRIYQQIADRDVLNARAIIKASGVVEFLTQEIAAAKDSHGPHVRVTVEALVVAMWLAANTGRPMLLTEFSDILFHCIYPKMRKMLNVRDGRTPRSGVPSKHRRWNKSAAKAVGQTFRRVCDVIDPSDEITTRKQRQWADMTYRGLSDEEAIRYQCFLDWVCNQLLLVSYNTMPASVRAADTGDRCIDGTGIELFTRSRGLDHPEAMSAPHAANWVRPGNHADPDEDEPARRGKPKHKARSDKWFPGLEAHLMTAGDTTPGDLQRFPNGLVTAMTMERPGIAPADCARRLMSAELDRGFNIGYITGDGLYAKADADTFQTPAREAGYQVILPILDEASGDQGSPRAGIVQNDGTFYGPCLPPHLRTVIEDYRAKTINTQTYKDRLASRKKFEMVTKQNADANGVGERVGCRAADHSLTVKCPLKPNSLQPRETLDRDGNLSDNRPLINLPLTVLTGGTPPTVCQCQAVTLKPTDGAKYRQAIPVGDKHTDLYNRLRQPQEGANGFAKDEAREALGVPGRRRVRTKVATQLFVAFLLAAANLRRIRSFLARAETDKNGILYVKRTPRTGSHARTGLPPGTPRQREPAATIAS